MNLDLFLKYFKGYLNLFTKIAGNLQIYPLRWTPMPQPTDIVDDTEATSVEKFEDSLSDEFDEFDKTCEVIETPRFELVSMSNDDAGENMGSKSQQNNNSDLELPACGNNFPAGLENNGIMPCMAEGAQDFAFLRECLNPDTDIIVGGKILNFTFFGHKTF